MLLVASETGHVYTFATRKLQPMITSESGKALIQTCLNSPDPSPANALQQTVQQAQVPIINPPPVVHNPSPPIQVTLSGASEQRMSQTGYEEPDLQYANSEDELKVTSFCVRVQNLFLLKRSTCFTFLPSGYMEVLFLLFEFSDLGRV